MMKGIDCLPRRRNRMMESVVTCVTRRQDWGASRQRQAGPPLARSIQGRRAALGCAHETRREADKACGSWLRRALTRWIVYALAALTSDAAYCREPSPAVRAALERGAEYLRRTQQPDGTWRSWGSHAAGETALAGMALVAAGVPAINPEVSKARDAVRRMVATSSDTYDLSLAIMFLDQLRNPEDTALLRQLGERLLAGQLPNGAWTYASGGVAFGGGDNSNTQFAAIACWVARKHGMVRDAAFGKLAAYFRSNFIPADGGWGYGAGAPATPTMTCAGLAGLATSLGAEEQGGGTQGSDARAGGPRKRRAATDPTVNRAFQALGRELVRANTSRDHPINSDLYFFWSLERVGMIYGVDTIADVDWYLWGCERLVKGQSPDGQWQGSGKWQYQKAVGTSFAMLFLSRLNVAADLTASVGLGSGAGEAKRTPSVALEGGSGGSEFIRRLPTAQRRGSAEGNATTPAPTDFDPRRGNR